MSVSSVKIYDSKEESLIEEFCSAEKIFFENAEKKFGSSTLLNNVLTSDKF